MISLPANIFETLKHITGLLLFIANVLCCLTFVYEISKKNQFIRCIDSFSGNRGEKRKQLTTCISSHTRSVFRNHSRKVCKNKHLHRFRIVETICFGSHSCRLFHLFVCLVFVTLWLTLHRSFRLYCCSVLWNISCIVRSHFTKNNGNKLYGDNNFVVGNCSEAISFKGSPRSFTIICLDGFFPHVCLFVRLHLCSCQPLIRINFGKSNCIQSDCYFTDALLLLGVYVTYAFVVRVELLGFGR